MYVHSTLSSDKLKLFTYYPRHTLVTCSTPQWGIHTVKTLQGTTGKHCPTAFSVNVAWSSFTVERTEVHFEQKILLRDSQQWKPSTCTSMSFIFRMIRILTDIVTPFLTTFWQTCHAINCRFPSMVSLHQRIITIFSFPCMLKRVLTWTSALALNSMMQTKARTSFAILSLGLARWGSALITAPISFMLIWSSLIVANCLLTEKVIHVYIEYGLLQPFYFKTTLIRPPKIGV